MVVPCTCVHTFNLAHSHCGSYLTYTGFSVDKTIASDIVTHACMFIVYPSRVMCFKVQLLLLAITGSQLSHNGSCYWHGRLILYNTTIRGSLCWWNLQYMCTTFNIIKCELIYLRNILEFCHYVFILSSIAGSIHLNA